jgi:deoxyribodipyrimidine photo-lyase
VLETVGLPENEQPGGASRWWLHHSLAQLSRRLEALGSQLVIRVGDVRQILPALMAETGAKAVFACRRHEPGGQAVDDDLTQMLSIQWFAGNTLVPPKDTRKPSDGKPFQVFTPFWKWLRQTSLVAEPLLPAPGFWPVPEVWPAGCPVHQMHLLPTHPDWAGGLRETWSHGNDCGEDAAQARFTRFLATALPGYATQRDRPDIESTSMLSPHLHFGEISPRQVWHGVQSVVASTPKLQPDADKFLSELAWREFSAHLLAHFPAMVQLPLRPEFLNFPWRTNEAALRAWQCGQTGYPLVDAGMRQLWHTGWMHNRVRMVVGSFLVKHLMLPWQAGAAWFWDTLVDADLANNTQGWQWVSGCGADAAPYFRVFNPIKQSLTFDPEGRYIARWLPALRALPPPWIHQPWTAAPDLLATYGVRLGETYPTPMVDHIDARNRALAAFDALKQAPPAWAARYDSTISRPISMGWAPAVMAEVDKKSAPASA